jgi:signal transduction histidine kinase
LWCYQGPENVTEISVTSRLGRKIEEVLPTDLAKKVRSNIESALLTKKIIHSKHQFRRNEQLQFVEARYIALSKEEVLMIIRDVTQQRHLEEQLRQSQKVEATGQLAGGIAHHYNNMLMAIMGYVSLALTELSPNHPIVKDLERIQNTAYRAATLTRQLLTFTSAQAGQPEVINLNDLIRNMEPLLHNLLSEAVEVQLNLAPNLAWFK